ncbi:MAG: RNase adapter RapZ [Oscillospiraceae bacterium]|nr:RNase adapter RapZ [Oscillospiraceae bacterium]
MKAEFIIITGMSGAGRSSAINALEDIGYFCIDNMPPQLMEKFMQLCDEESEIEKVAFGCDVRSGEMFLTLVDTLTLLKQKDVNVKVLFMDAPDEVIKRRYKETRRLPPLYEAVGDNLDKAIWIEREALAPIAEIADYTIDTGSLKTSALKEAVLNLFLDKISDSMLIKCTSFGFKYGIPGDADLVFDVRFLTNPFYIPELKAKNGLTCEVRNFVMKSDDAKELERKLNDLIDFLIPRYIAEGKSQLVIAFGCTGGKHRSVTFTERLSKRLSDKDYRVIPFHRDIGKG